MKNSTQIIVGTVVGLLIGVLLALAFATAAGDGGGGQYPSRSHQHVGK